VFTKGLSSEAARTGNQVEGEADLRLRILRMASIMGRSFQERERERERERRAGHFRREREGERAACL
jgi:type IV secretory pathway ATPase VirB11/archaellum biosynthesis ATPase